MRVEVGYIAEQHDPETSDIGQRCVEEIRQRMQAENINATGDTSRSLTVLTETSFRLTLAAVGHHAPFPSLQEGQPPYQGDLTPLVAALEQWVQVKPGFLLRGTPQQAAAAIARKIASFGTDRYINPRNDIYTPAFEVAVARMRNKVKGALIELIKK